MFIVIPCPHCGEESKQTVAGGTPDISFPFGEAPMDSLMLLASVSPLTCENCKQEFWVEMVQNPRFALSKVNPEG
jgi:hypothetical protein